MNAASPALVSPGQKITASHINAIRNSVVAWEAAVDANGFNVTEAGNIEMSGAKYLSVGAGAIGSGTRMWIARNSTDKLLVIGDNPYGGGTSATVGYGIDADSTGILYHDMKVGDSSDEIRFRTGTTSETGAARQWMRISGNTGEVQFAGDTSTTIAISGTGRVHMVGNTSRAFDTIRTPSTSSEACNRGEMAFDLTYLYLCDTTNQWKRIATSSF